MIYAKEHQIAGQIARFRPGTPLRSPKVAERPLQLGQDSLMKLEPKNKDRHSSPVAGHKSEYAGGLRSISGCRQSP